MPILHETKVEFFGSFGIHTGHAESLGDFRYNSRAIQRKNWGQRPTKRTGAIAQTADKLFGLAKQKTPVCFRREIAENREQTASEAKHSSLNKFGAGRANQIALTDGCDQTFIRATCGLSCLVDLSDRGGIGGS